MRRFASLRRVGDFARLRRSGRRTASANLTFFRGDAAASDPRPLVGITVSKSVGKAVTRNLLRRRLAAIVHDALAPQARLRLLIVARPCAAAAPFSALRDEVRRVLG